MKVQNSSRTGKCDTRVRTDNYRRRIWSKSLDLQIGGQHGDQHVVRVYARIVRASGSLQKRTVRGEP